MWIIEQYIKLFYYLLSYNSRTVENTTKGKKKEKEQKKKTTFISSFKLVHKPKQVKLVLSSKLNGKK